MGTPSGWSYTQVVQGGESFVALSEGLQNALAACGGVPAELRTDRLSAACRNRNGSFSADITRRYHALCSHYGLSYSRNNLGVAHENGRVESPHGHLKRRIEQALLLRGSSDFETLAAYQAFLVEVAAGYNRPRLMRLEQEKAALRKKGEQVALICWEPPLRPPDPVPANPDPPETGAIDSVVPDASQTRQLGRNHPNTSASGASASTASALTKLSAALSSA